jgi:hypothetical protein
MGSLQLWDFHDFQKLFGSALKNEKRPHPMWQTIGVFMAKCQSNHKNIKIQSTEMRVKNLDLLPMRAAFD